MISEVCSISLTNLALHSSCAVLFDAVELPVNYLLMSTVIELKGVLPELNMVDRTWEFAGAHMYKRVLSNSRSWLQTRLVCLFWRSVGVRQAGLSRYG